MISGTPAPSTQGGKYYFPFESGYEKPIKERMRGWEETKKGKV